MDCYDLWLQPLKGKHLGKFGLVIMRLDRFGMDDLPFHTDSVFNSRLDALRRGARWVASQGGAVRKSVIADISRWQLSI
jgi:hypothetical protein